uniref:Retrotransposon gag domain-containing protein n=1 Tax=Bracon brevicornis TaxID=1563983 RepID=A0A6V7IMU4_9HYME
MADDQLSVPPADVLPDGARASSQASIAGELEDLGEEQLPVVNQPPGAHHLQELPREGVPVPEERPLPRQQPPFFGYEQHYGQPHRGPPQVQPRRPAAQQHRQATRHDPDDYQVQTDDDSGCQRRERPLTTAALMYLMQKWDLTLFSSKRGEDIEHFISRIEEGLACFTVADETILRVLPFYLRGGDLTWFRAHTAQLTTWERTRENLRSRYGDPDYQRTLRREIDQRTQGDQEATGDYFACMRD